MFRRDWPLIVFAPASLCLNWKREFMHWGNLRDTDIVIVNKAASVPYVLANVRAPKKVAGKKRKAIEPPAPRATKRRKNDSKGIAVEDELDLNALFGNAEADSLAHFRDVELRVKDLLAVSCRPRHGLLATIDKTDRVIATRLCSLLLSYAIECPLVFVVFADSFFVSCWICELSLGVVRFRMATSRASSFATCRISNRCLR
jgi:hypothetical protein